MSVTGEPCASKELPVMGEPCASKEVSERCVPFKSPWLLDPGPWPLTCKLVYVVK